MPDNSIIRKTLVSAASILATAMRNRAQANNLPARVADSISIGEVQESGKKLYIDITVDLKKAPEAAAYEFGSGLHRTIGTPSEYIIEPKNAKALAFEWPNYWENIANSLDMDADPLGPVKRSPKFIAYDESSGKFIFRFVEHPGVEPRPFIRPSIKENISKLRRMFRNGLKIYVKSYMKETVSTIERLPTPGSSWEVRTPMQEPVSGYSGEF